MFESSDCSNRLVLQLMGPRAPNNALQAPGSCSHSIVWMDFHTQSQPPQPNITKVLTSKVVLFSLRSLLQVEIV